MLLLFVENGIVDFIICRKDADALKFFILFFSGFLCLCGKKWI